jgi:outer membrane protein assembly factor BamD (BamD/ComL family)
MLSAGDPEQALKLASEDEQLHPDGVLGEERDAVRISALVKLHRMDEARSAASRFIQEYPTSVHRVVVERAMSGEEPREESP